VNPICCRHSAAGHIYSALACEGLCIALCRSVVQHVSYRNVPHCIPNVQSSAWDTTTGGGTKPSYHEAHLALQFYPGYAETDLAIFAEFDTHPQPERGS
jgi:hypothetical protein